MLLLRGATRQKRFRVESLDVSIHAPLARSNAHRQAVRSAFPFQYMLLLRGATIAERLHIVLTFVSIHAPLARSYFSRRAGVRKRISFNTCSSCEEQHGETITCQKCSKFQYMLLLRGATPKLTPISFSSQFQYMLLLRGATRLAHRSRYFIRVSIHAPLARSNC